MHFSTSSTGPPNPSISLCPANTSLHVPVLHVRALVLELVPLRQLHALALACVLVLALALETFTCTRASNLLVLVPLLLVLLVVMLVLLLFPERAWAQGSRFVSVGPLALSPGHMPRGWSDLFGMKKYGKIRGLSLVGYKKVTTVSCFRPLGLRGPCKIRSIGLRGTG